MKKVFLFLLTGIFGLFIASSVLPKVDADSNSPAAKIVKSNESYILGEELLTNGDVAKEEFADGEWQNMAWGGFDQNRVKITWAWDATDPYTGDAGFYQDLELEANKDYLLEFTGMEYNVSGRDQHSLQIGLTSREDRHTFLAGQSVEIAGEKWENGANYVYYIAFNSGSNTEVSLVFKTQYEAPVENNTFGGFFLSAFSFKEIVDVVKELNVDTLTPELKNDFYTLAEEELLVNGDVAKEEFVDGEWQNMAWCGFDQNRVKITWAWDATDPYTGDAGFYQDLELEPNKYYLLQFTGMEWNVSGRDQHSLQIGLTSRENRGTFLEGQSVEIAGEKWENGTNYTYYVAFYSGSLTEVSLVFKTQYEAPVTNETFGGFFLSAFSFKEITESSKLTVVYGKPMQKSLYIAEQGAEDLFVNADVAITDFEQAGVAWKDYSWAGFDGQRVKITYAWEAGLEDGFPVGFYQDVAVKPNTDYQIDVTAMQWNLSNNPDHTFKIGFISTESKDLNYIDSREIMVKHNSTERVTVTLNSGDNENVRVVFMTTYENPNITGNFGGFFFSDFSMTESVDLIKDADVNKQEFGDWKDLAWAGFDAGDGRRLKITWAWDSAVEGGFPVGFYQPLTVEPNTDYVVKFDVMEWNVSGRDQHGLELGFADPETKEFIAGQSCTITADKLLNGTVYTYYVAFNSGENEEVLLLFKTQYEAPVENNTFGGFFFDNFSCKKIVGVSDPTFDLTPVPAEGYYNYLYLGKTGNETIINPNITNLSDFGISASDVTYTFSSNNSDEIATVDENGKVVAGTKTGLFVVNVTATYDLDGILVKGSGSIKLRVIEPTTEGVFINDSESLPFETTGASILANGDFETAIMDVSTTDHTLRADTWRSVIGTWMNTEAQAGQDGSTGGKITWRWQDGLTEDDWPCFYEDVAVEPRTLYELTFHVYNWDGTKAGENNLIVGFRDRNSEDIWHNVQAYYIATPLLGYGYLGWTEVTVYLYSNELTEARVFFTGKAQSGHDGGAGWWFDNITLKKVSGIKAGQELEVTGATFNVPSTMRQGAQAEISAFAVYEYGYQTEISGNITLTSSNSDVIAVENGKLVAKSVGTATITAKVDEVEQSYEVRVLPIPTSVTVSVGSDNTIEVNRDQKIKVTVTYSDGTTEVLTNNCTFTVSDDSIIYQKGATMYLGGKKVGKATLTVNVNIDGTQLSGSVEVTVFGETDEPEEPAPKKGCRSAIGSSMVIISLISLATVVFAVKRKED